MASSPLIVDGFRPTHLSSDVRTGSDDGKRAQPSQHGDRSASAACDTPKPGVAGRKNSSGQVRNDGRGQVESHLGRTRLTSDAPYKDLLTKFRGQGDTIHYSVLKPDFFVISKTSPEGSDAYMRCHAEGTGILGFSLFWNNAAGNASGERIEILTSGSLRASMMGARFAPPPVPEQVAR